MIRWLQPAAAALILVVAVLARIASAPLDPLAGTTHLIVVETDGFNDSQARLVTFQRAEDGKPWQAVGEPQPVTLGRAGIGWGHTFRHLARDGEPIKREGDKRAPAGIFPLGQPFGLIASDLPGYMQLAENRHFCVDDPKSPHYSRIVPTDSAGQGTSGERMWEIDLYQHGLVVEYPTSAQARSGSCIFLHVWKQPGTPTAGCVAMAPDAMQHLQRWVNGAQRAAIAILPATARGRLKLSLP